MKREKLIVNNEEYNVVEAGLVSAQRKTNIPNAKVVGVDVLIDPKKNNHAITLIALIITMVLHYYYCIKYSNSNGFLKAIV